MGSIAQSIPIVGSKTKGDYPQPLKQTGVLERFEYEDVTPVIGREFPSANIVDDFLNSLDGDALLRDLAITISERGVVFFRKQDNLSNDLQKQFVHRLGQLVGKPTDSSLHIHPVLNGSGEFGDDPQISNISSVNRKKLFGPQEQKDKRKYDAAQWHSDIQFEPVPADYTSLRLVELPKTGGDTLWASGYEIYERFSQPVQKFLEGLTATFSGVGFIKAAEAGRATLYEQERGSPQNVGRKLTAVHPVVRTNPVTGWKSVFAIGPFPQYINEVHEDESRAILKKLHDTITDNHDLQVRFKWRNKNDIAIWDNRSVFHSATFDYDNLGERFGNRAVGIGEAPYLDPNSRTRTEDISV